MGDSSRAEAEAAKIVFKAIRPEILDNRHKPKEIERIAEPILGSRWSKELILKVGSKPINDILDCIKATDLDRSKVGVFRKISHTAFFGQSEVFPVKWEIWRDLITRYHLFEVIPFASWAKLLFKVESLKIDNPLDLGGLNFQEVVSVDTSQDANGGYYLTLAVMSVLEGGKSSGEQQNPGKIWRGC